MKETAPPGFSRRKVFISAFRYSIPVLLGYTTLGAAFGLMLSGMGYPWYLALAMSLWMYAGAGQFIAAGFFATAGLTATGTGLLQACLIQFVVNARHIAYGLSMQKKFGNCGPYKPYLVFSLTDETFALLSSLPENHAPGGSEGNRPLFMFYVSLLDQCYWVAGSIAGSLAVSFIPFELKGIEFALTALFVVLMVEQILKVKKPDVFIFSGLMSLLCVFFLPERISILAALVLAILITGLAGRKSPGTTA